MRWWNEEQKDTIARKKVAFQEVCKLPSEENKTQYKRLKKSVAKYGELPAMCLSDL